jgi:hypothetical protein
MKMLAAPFHFEILEEHRNGTPHDDEFSAARKRYMGCGGFD